MKTDNYLETYKRLCYVSNLDDLGTVAATRDIVETLRHEAIDFIRASWTMAGGIRSGKPWDIEYLWLSSEAAEILEAIAAHNDRCKNKQCVY